MSRKSVIIFKLKKNTPQSEFHKLSPQIMAYKVALTEMQVLFLREEMR